MPSYIVRSENYRDELLKFSYPFDERSSLQEESLFIGPDLLLDAIIYLKTPAELPLHISQADGTYGTLQQAQFLIADANGAIVARAVLDLDCETTDVLNNDGQSVGLLVMHRPGLQRFLSDVSGQIIDLNSDTATFSLDVTHVATVPYFRYIAVDKVVPEGDHIRLIARHGVQFTYDGENLSLNILGDSPSLLFDTEPIRSINGVANPSIWLAGHPRANLRVSSANSRITFVAVRDAT